MAGVKRAALIGVVLPALILLVPLHVALLGWRFAALHLTYGLCVAAAALDIGMLGLRTLPFASSYVCGGNLKAWLPLYLIALIPVTRLLAWLERFALREAESTLILLAALALVSATVRILDKRQRQRYGPIDFYEVPAETQRLDLSA
jgi:hypothetical protein